MLYLYFAKLGRSLLRCYPIFSVAPQLSNNNGHNLAMITDDVQISLDPELLGHVFENLLASYNPETSDSARKLTGSFYTPREIVNYMADESLIAYLQFHCPDLKENDIRIFFSTHIPPAEWTDEQCQQIAEATKSIKILDPTCGSGAFPMGCLLRMVEIIEFLQPEKEDKYTLKLHLIENCIYGVDIQPIAMLITKLRFFISLICEQQNIDFSKPEENFGINTLPNLETKFVAANTLIRIKKKVEQGNLFENPEIDKTKKELIDIRNKHFYAKSTYRKAKLREQDETLRNKLAELLQKNEMFAPDDAVQFAQWNPYDQNASSPFFDPEWMFGVKGGFDIVIGNPPYIQLQNNGGALAKEIEGQKFQTFARTGDIYCCFYERGVQLLKQNGFLCFITSNKWMRAGYGEATRKFFAENTNPLQLLDFAGVKIFESSTVDTNILLLQKSKYLNKTLACVTKSAECRNNLSDYFKQNSSISNFAESGSGSWVVLSPIEQSIKRKIEKIGTPLKDWDIQINCGIKTGCNEAFIISGAKKDELIKADPKSAEIILPILRGRDIKRYRYNFADLWLINTHNGIKEKGIKPIDIKNYPAVKAHLDKYWKKIEKRADQGDTPYNLRNCAYLGDFNKQKVCWTPVNSEYRFTILPPNIFFNNSLFMITGESIEFICACCNSNLYQFYLSKILSGGNYQYGSGSFFENLPIFHISTKEQKTFIELVDQQLQNPCEETETKISHLVYKLYSLTQEEINYIEKY